LSARNGAACAPASIGLVQPQLPAAGAPLLDDVASRGGVVLLLAGDVMTGRGIDQVLAHPGAPVLYEPHVRDAPDYVRMAEAVNGPVPAPVPVDYVWCDALGAVDHAALRIVNLETAVTTAPEPWPGKGIHYRMHPANVGCLTAARIDCCVLANNHVLDWGRAGLRQTLQTLQAVGLRTAGAGLDDAHAWAPATLPLAAGGRVQVFAFATASSGVPEDWAAAPGRPGVALLPELSEASARRLAETIARQREPGDVTVVSIHWGGNWGLAVPGAHRHFAHRLVELGAADLVHGHSSHHPLPLEVHQGKLILYGCGDLINDYEGIDAHDSLRSDVGCLYFAKLHRGDARLLQLDVLPMQLRRFRLTTADAAARAWLERIFSGGAPLGPGAQGGWCLRPPPAA
jgi:poly-gamma-glutamate synthesis protein (capsule biosynthesis protein)